MDLAQLSAALWRRHGNPLSLWSRLLTTPLCYLPFWNRSWRQGLAVAAWFAVNPWLFPAPKNQGAWAARAIRGERRWVKARPKDASLAVQGLGSLALLGGVYSAYRRRPAPTIISAAVVIGCNAWFLDRMARTYGVAPEVGE